MTDRLSIAALSLLLTLTAGGALAQTPPATPATMAAPAAPPMMKKGAKPRTAQSIACSAKADAQNLHGKPRKGFMSSCKAGK
jgi:hypothetical protein